MYAIDDASYQRHIELVKQAQEEVVDFYTHFDDLIKQGLDRIARQYEKLPTNPKLIVKELSKIFDEIQLNLSEFNQKSTYTNKLKYEKLFDNLLYEVENGPHPLDPEVLNNKKIKTDIKVLLTHINKLEKNIMLVKNKAEDMYE